MTKKPASAPVDLLFDARHIRSSGIGTYIRTQLPYLQQTLARRHLSLTVLADQDAVPTLEEGTRVLLSRPSAAPMYSAQEQIAWDNALKSTRPRAIWVPHYPYPLALYRRRNSGTLTFITVHDTIHLLERNISSQSLPRRMYARTMLNIDARRCRKIFTPSQVTADSIQALVPSAPVMVTPIPMDRLWFTSVDPSLAPVQGTYILYVGNAKRHKNLPILLKAFSQVADAIPQKLVIAGGGESLRTLDERVRLLADAQGDRVIVTGRLDFEALRSLVAGADLLVMPSLFEGAGLPPLEAMASHTAVLASSIPALRETCGDGADYFDPSDDQALAHLLRTYCRDDVARAGLAARGWSHVTTRQAEFRSTPPRRRCVPNWPGTGHDHPAPPAIVGPARHTCRCWVLPIAGALVGQRPRLRRRRRWLH